MPDPPDAPLLAALVAVVFAAGGASLIKVTDDGCGLPPVTVTATAVRRLPVGTATGKGPLVLGLRADVFGDALRVPALLAWLQDNQMVVGAMSSARPGMK